MIKYSKYLKNKKCAIFLFHGVIKRSECKVRNYTKKHLEKKRFIEIVKDLKEKGNAISMDTVLNYIQNSIPFKDKSFAITFDDGFYNNYSIAAPILNKLKLPTTFYVTTDFINFNHTSWIDRIEIFLEKIKMNIKVKTFFGDFIIENSSKSKIFFLDKVRTNVKKNLKINPYKFSNDLIKQINNYSNYKTSKSILDRKMNWRHVKILSNNPLFTIGGHSKSHKIFSSLSMTELKKDIKYSIKTINKKLNTRIKHYSYPEGLKNTYSNREIRILKNNGIVICPSAEFGLNDHRSNLFHLNRIFCSE